MTLYKPEYFLRWTVGAGAKGVCLREGDLFSVHVLLNALIVVLVEQEVTQTKENDSLSRKSWRVLFVRPGTILVNCHFPFTRVGLDSC